MEQSLHDGLRALTSWTVSRTLDTLVIEAKLTPIERDAIEPKVVQAVQRELHSAGLMRHME